MGKARHLVVATALFFGAQKVALSEPEPDALPTVRNLTVSDIVVPPELGYVIETHPAAEPSRPLIVHIQEAHTNYDAQQHIADILERLVTRHGLKLILVEGGEGDVGLSYLRSYGPPDNRRQVAGKYLKLGILSGEEYLDIVSDHPLILWGVESDRLHDQNVQVFLEAEGLQQVLTPVLASVRQAVEDLKPLLFDQRLLTLDAKANAFDEEQLALAEYAAYLAGAAKAAGLAEDASPQVAAFVAVSEAEQGLDLELVQRQQKEVVNRLRDLVDAKAFAGLTQQAQGVQEGRASHEGFYAALEALAAGARFDLAQFPSLSRYIRYVTARPSLKPAALAKELDQLAARLRRALATTPQAQQLRMIADEVDLIQKLLELRLSPQEYRQFQALTVPGLSSRWAGFLNEQLTQRHLPIRSFERLAHLESSVPALQRFYEIAYTRDEALIERTMAKLDETHEPLAVLITGGFHGPQLTRRLKEEGVGVAVITPKVTQPTNERLYHAVLKYKSGHGSFDEVEAAAQMVSATGPTAQGGIRQ